MIVNRIEHEHIHALKNIRNTITANWLSNINETLNNGVVFMLH